MAKKVENEHYDVKYIPDNVEVGVNIMGGNFVFRNFIEAVILGAIGLLASVLLFMLLPFLGTGIKIFFGLLITFVLAFLGLMGVNDEPLSIYYKNKMAVRRKKRTAYYYPRIYKEYVPYILEQSEKDEKKEEKKQKGLLNFFEKNDRKKRKIKAEKNAMYQTTDYFQAESLYFADDEKNGIKKPKSYMSETELKNENKKDELTQKELIKFAKQLDREGKR